MSKNEIGKAYSAIGSVFEYLNRDCGYDKWSQYLIKKLQNFKAGARGVDLGCGNGYFTRALSKAGYNVLGVDVSENMLSTALELARAEGCPAQFVLGDATELNLNFKPDFIVAVNDCVNYIPPQKLNKTFKKIYACLKKGGMFLFDISSENKLKNIIGNNTFADDDNAASYIWFNELFDDRVEMDITVFTRGQDGLYSRAEERQTQYIYGETEILTALQAAGFAVETEGHLGEKKDERINFICTK